MSEEVGGCQAWTWEEPDRRGGRESQTMKPVLSAPEAHQWARVYARRWQKGRGARTWRRKRVDMWWERRAVSSAAAHSKRVALPKRKATGGGEGARRFICLWASSC